MIRIILYLFKSCHYLKISRLLGCVLSERPCIIINCSYFSGCSIELIDSEEANDDVQKPEEEVGIHC